jgi:hypothetical protein
MMNVSSEDKMKVLGVLYPRLFEALAGCTEDGEVTGDDVVDFFAMAIGALLDNDSNLTTPQQLRLGVATAAKRAEVWTKEFRKVQDATGTSWLSTVINEPAGEPH